MDCVYHVRMEDDRVVYVDALFSKPPTKAAIVKSLRKSIMDDYGREKMKKIISLLKDASLRYNKHGFCGECLKNDCSLIVNRRDIY
jgi:hypothetical protein